MDGDYSADGKLYSSLYIGPQATANRPDKTENNFEAASDNMYVHDMCKIM